MSRPFWKSSWRSLGGVALRLGGSAIILAVLFTFLPLGEVWATFRRFSFLLWLLVLAGYLSAHLIGACKWRLMVNLAGAGLSFAQSVRCYFAGLFSTLFLPSIVGGDVVRAGLALRLGHSKAGVLLGSLLDRMIDLMALTCLAAFGALLIPGALDPRSRRVFIVVGAAFVSVALAAALLVAVLPARRFSYRMRRRLARVRRAARSMAQRPQYVLAALGIGLVVQTSLIALTATIAAACHLWLLFRVWLFVWPLAKLSALLPVSQGGIGVREAALAALLVPFGARAVVVVAVGLAWETVVISGGLLAGLVAFFVGRSASWKPSSVAASPMPNEKSVTPPFKCG